MTGSPSPEIIVTDKSRAIAVLIDHVDHLGTSYETELRATFRAACAEHGLDLHVLVGRALESSDPWSQPHNEVYRLVRAGWIDGLVIMTPGLAASCGAERIRMFCEGYRPLPMCSVGEQVPGVPSVVVDNKLGMQAVIEHLVSEHGCRRVAFIGGVRGNPDAEARLAIYRAVLEKYGLPYRDELVGFGDFTIPTGAAAVHGILDRNVEFDALVGANDGMALGAMAVLKERGVQVPRDVRAAGFDDVVLSRLSNPPLTTARQPLRSMARHAVQIIVDQIAGRPVASSTCFAVELVTRQSCGCGGSTASEAASGELCDTRPATSPARTWQSGEPSRGVARISSELERSLIREQDAFLSTLQELLSGLEEHTSPEHAFQSAIATLRDEPVRSETPSFWESVRHVLTVFNARTLVRENLDVKVSYRSLLKCGERLSNAADAATLKAALAEELPLLGVTNVLLGVFADPDHRDLELFFGLRDSKRYEPPIARRPVMQWLRDARELRAGSGAWLMLALTFEAECLGVVIFEMNSNIGVYDVLREQISLALKDLALHEQIVQRTAQHERSLQERRVAMERMNALSVMAGGVAHDLNSALAPILVIPDIVQKELDRIGIAEEVDARVRSDIETIKIAGLRAAEIVKDLMTLGGQGRPQKHTLDLNRVIASCLMGEPCLAAERQARRLDVSLKLYPSPLLIQASRHHLERAVSNLVRNAVEAISGAGEITVNTSRASLADSRSGYEIIAAGDYALVTVSDSGDGIPKQQLDRVFEPFFSTKRSSDENARGLGLAIVHGVVKEHDGFVDVSSATGKGTTFTLYFPITASAVQ